jgi:hypothetical protein
MHLRSQVQYYPRARPSGPDADDAPRARLSAALRPLSRNVGRQPGQVPGLEVQGRERSSLLALRIRLPLWTSGTAVATLAARAASFTRAAAATSATKDSSDSESLPVRALAASCGPNAVRPRADWAALDEAARAGTQRTTCKPVRRDLRTFPTRRPRGLVRNARPASR